MNLTDPLRALARSQPDAPAIRTDVVTVSFAELDRAVSNVATSFAAAGLAAGDAVGISVSNQIRHLITSLGLARLGAGQLVFHDTDSATIKRELAKRVRLAAVIADKRDEEEVGPPRVPPPGDLDEMLRRDGAPFEPAADGRLPFLYQRTSGTTGIPKIAPMSHKAGAYRFGPQPIDLPDMRAFSLIPVSFDAAKHSLFRCLLLGGTVMFSGRLNLEGIGEFIARHRVNYINGTPVHADQLLKVAPSDGLLLPGVKVFRLGTSTVSEPLRQDICRRLTPNLYVYYGMTEIGTVSMATPEDIARIPGCVGRPLPDVEVEIRDEQGQLVPAGTIGRVRVRSPGLIDGYLDSEEENAEKFCDGWYHSDDLCAATPEGLLIHHGRADEMMIFDGINIHPTEIEAVLLRHPAVAEAAAFGFEDQNRGDVPVGAVVVKRPVSSKELMAHCKSWLGTRTIRGLMLIPALPKTQTGKVIKRDLVELYGKYLAKRRVRADDD